MCNKILKEPEARTLLIVVSCHIMLVTQLEEKLIKHTEDLGWLKGPEILLWPGAKGPGAPGSGVKGPKALSPSPGPRGLGHGPGSWVLGPGPGPGALDPGP